jgi:DNA replication protein DnaC
MGKETKQTSRSNQGKNGFLALPKALKLNMKTINCKKCGKPFDNFDFNNGKLLKYLSLSSRYCLECRNVAIKEQEVRFKLERERLIQSQKAKWLLDCGIPNRFINASFKDFDKATYKTIYKNAHNYISTINLSDVFKARSFYIYSNKDVFGVGKTYLAASIARAIIQKWDGQGWDGEYDIKSPLLYTSEHDFLLKVRASFNHRFDPQYETEDEVYSRLMRIPILVLDDIGKEETDKKDLGGVASSAFVRRAYWQVIDGRYQASLPIVITANYSLVDIKRFLGEASTQRIVEMCGSPNNIVKLQGESKRKMLKACDND